MKSLALALALGLHLLGLWPHVSSLGKAQLARTASSDSASPQVPIYRDALPVRTGTEAYPVPKATASYLAIDRATSLPLAASNANTPRPIASITKLVTAMVILSRHQPSDMVTVGQLPDYPEDADTMGLSTGETYRVADLVRAALVPSANDAADALALYDAGSVTAFAARMNAKLAEWGITGAQFSNPSGLTDEGNTASAISLSKIAGLALTQPLIREAVGQTDITVVGGPGRTFNLHTTDELLANGDFHGIKTGYTGAAGQCFVGLTTVDGHDVITVVLGSDDRFGDTRGLINWIGQHYQWLTP